MKKYLHIDQLSDGELKRQIWYGRFLILRRWVVAHQPQSIAISLGVGLFPVSIVKGTFLEWAGIALIFSLYFILDDKQHKLDDERHNAARGRITRPHRRR